VGKATRRGFHRHFSRSKGNDELSVAQGLFDHAFSLSDLFFHVNRIEFLQESAFFKGISVGAASALNKKAATIAAKKRRREFERPEGWIEYTIFLPFIILVVCDLA
jgi:hypothetical protein